jgi:hypothetical protein
MNYKIITELDEPPLINFKTKYLSTQFVSLQNEFNIFKSYYKIIFEFANLPNDIENVIFDYLHPKTDIKCAYSKVLTGPIYYSSYIIALRVVTSYEVEVYIKMNISGSNEYIVLKNNRFSLYNIKIRNIICDLLISTLNAKKNDIFFGKSNSDNYKRKQIIKSLIRNSHSINKILIIDKIINYPWNILIICVEKIYVIEQRYDTELLDILTYIEFDMTNSYSHKSKRTLIQKIMW